MKVHIPSLREGETTFEFCESSESLDLGSLPARFGLEIPVTLRLDKHENEIIILASVRGTVTEECSRCLKVYDRKFDIEFQIFCDKIGSHKMDEEAGSETFTVFHDGRTLELGPSVREAIVLSLPMRPLCSDNCKGLCPVCGTDLNKASCECSRVAVDPRWTALERLKEEGREKKRGSGTGGAKASAEEEAGGKKETKGKDRVEGNNNDNEKRGG